MYQSIFAQYDLVLTELGVWFLKLHVNILSDAVSFQLSEGKNREEQLRQQMAEKEEKTKKAFMGAKTKINQLNSKFHTS